MGMDLHKVQVVLWSAEPFLHTKHFAGLCHKLLTTTTGIELTLKDFPSYSRALVILGISTKNVLLNVRFNVMRS